MVDLANQGKRLAGISFLKEEAGEENIKREPAHERMLQSIGTRTGMSSVHGAVERKKE